MSGMKFEKEIFMKYWLEKYEKWLRSNGNKEEIYDRCNDFLFLCSRSGRNR